MALEASKAKIFFNNPGNDNLEELSMLLWVRELDTIKRTRPLLDPKAFPVKTVGIYHVNWQEALGEKAIKPKKASKTTAAEVIDLTDLDDDDDDNNNTCNSSNKVTSPTSLMQRNWHGTSSAEEVFPREWITALANVPIDLETALTGSYWAGFYTQWRNDQQKNKQSHGGRPVPQLLFKGFPMMEDVVFFKHSNFWTDPDGIYHADSGCCYWLSLALILYGNPRAWLRVKAEHLNFLEQVFSDSSHPRYTYYTRMNQHKMQTVAPTGTVDASLFEMLHTPGCWVSDEMCNMTADIYNVFIVLYKYDSPNKDNEKWKNKVYDMKAFGSYNNRHIFLCFTNENHFQPMVPNDYLAHEFKLPRITLESTKKYKMETNAKARKNVEDGPKHYMRNWQFTPLFHMPSFTIEHLSRAAGVPMAPKSHTAFSKVPQPTPPASERARRFAASSVSSSRSSKPLPLSLHGKHPSPDLESPPAKRLKTVMGSRLVTAPGYIPGFTEQVRPQTSTPRSRPQESDRSQTSPSKHHDSVLSPTTRPVHPGSGSQLQEVESPTPTGKLVQVEAQETNQANKRKETATSSKTATSSNQTMTGKATATGKVITATATDKIITSGNAITTTAGKATPTPKATNSGQATTGSKASPSGKTTAPGNKKTVQRSKTNDPPGAEWKSATKSLLRRIRLDSLQVLCFNHGLGKMGGEIEGWTKEQCVQALLNLQESGTKVQIRMVKDGRRLVPDLRWKWLDPQLAWGEGDEYEKEVEDDELESGGEDDHEPPSEEE